MVDRLLFYTNSWDKVKEFMDLYNQLIASGYEVAFSTDSIDLARDLSVGRMLVVKVGTYAADVYVSTQKIKELPEAISLNKLKEVVLNE